MKTLFVLLCFFPLIGEAQVKTDSSQPVLNSNIQITDISSIKIQLSDAAGKLSELKGQIIGLRSQIEILTKEKDGLKQSSVNKKNNSAL